MTDQAEEHDRRIVVGVDGSPGSRIALRWAVTQAELSNARVVDVVGAWHDPAEYAFAYGWSPAVFEDVSIAAITREDAGGGGRGRGQRWCARPVHHPGGTRASGSGAAGCRGRGAVAGGGQPGTRRLRRDAARLGQPALRTARVVPSRFEVLVAAGHGDRARAVHPVRGAATRHRWPHRHRPRRPGREVAGGLRTAATAVVSSG